MDIIDCGRCLSINIVDFGGCPSIDVVGVNRRQRCLPMATAARSRMCGMSIDGHCRSQWIV